MARKMPMSHLGPHTQTDPISGEVKRPKEGIGAFATRHGWEVTYDQDPDGPLGMLYMTKGEKRAEAALWPGQFYRGIATAVLNRVPLPQTPSFPTRERVEAYLSGVKCICKPVYEVPFYEQQADPECVIHEDGSARV